MLFPELDQRHVPQNAEIDIRSAQLELARILDAFIKLAPVDEKSIPHSYQINLPKSRGLLGNGLIRATRQGHLEIWTRFTATRTTETLRLFGRDLMPPLTRYTACWSDDTTNSGYAPTHSDRIVFYVGDYTKANMDDYNLMTKHADHFVREAAGLPIRQLPITPEMALRGVDKPEGVRDEVWERAQDYSYDALYFMQRPEHPSTQGARFLVNQEYVPEVDQIADIAILNTLKYATLQIASEPYRTTS